MEQQLTEVLNGTTDNYILPFLWLRGENEEILAEEVEKIYQSGIGAFCVESRPHEEFCGEGWWRDMDLLLKEAKKRGMKVWILDDKHYPTGTANDSLPRHPQARPWLLAQQHLDVAGPFSGACLLAAKGETLQDEDHRLLRVLAYPRSGRGEELLPKPIDLTGQVKGDFLYWEVPEGVFRIVMIFLTRRGEMAGHISMIDEESVKILLEEVYEPHYRRYGEEFGSTIAGFFSDEPGFFNQMLEGSCGFYEHKVGTPGLALPWRPDMERRLEEQLGWDVTGLLAALWFDLGEVTASVRVAYMDLITGLYRDCFTRQLGEWCRSHHVQYIGHVVEDNNCHARLFQGAGHYFRAMDGQDMAGVDVVLHQLLPGFGAMSHTSSAGLADGAFFGFVLAKLAGSMANLNPRMQGRALCELYGAYGWAEGLPVMKWMTDHMLVRGINHFVPHAFSPAYPDSDCPPHFYGRGHNPWYQHFRILMEYTNKMSHLLSGGRPVIPAAVLYHGEAEWSGGRYRYMQEPCRLLAEHQIDYHIVPGESLEDAVWREGRLWIGQMSYQCLVVSECELLPKSFLRSMDRLAWEGAVIYLVHGIPRGIAFPGEADDGAGSGLAQRAAWGGLAELPGYLLERGFYDIRLQSPAAELRYCHIVREQSHFYMLFNEGMTSLETEVEFPMKQESCVLMDVMSGECHGQHLEQGRLSLELEPWESVVVVFDEGLELPEEEREAAEELLISDFQMELRRTGEEEFAPYRENSGLFDITGPEGIQEFSGTIGYRAIFEGRPGRAWLQLGQVGETATVWLNGRLLGTRICAPYRFWLEDVLLLGENRLEIQVVNSPAYYERDTLSKKMMLSSSGLLGPVKICYEREAMKRNSF